jgi:hypothetical protein
MPILRPLRLAIGLAALPALPALSAVPLAAAAQVHAPPELRVHRLSGDADPIRIDGRLDEAAWRGASPADGFRQREPDVGQSATEPTEVRVAHDGATLYVGVLARSSQPDGVVARILQRDRIARVGFEPGLRFLGDDVIAILVDPFHDRRSAYVFATNPNGAELDALISNDGQETNLDWRGVFRVAAARSDDGWSAEFAIPLRSLRYPAAPGAVWGFNVVRFTARTNEESLWTSWSRDNEGFERVSNAGHLLGLDQLPRSGLSLEAKPYLLTGGTRTVDGLSTVNDGRLDAGLDLKWEPTAGLVLDLTANTDFAQAEIDDERVNLTRFSLFYPEKREFFLENAGVFDFGIRGDPSEPPPFLMFFSRRIGIADDGAVPLLGGARLTGRLGRQSLGVLDVVTEPAFGAPRTNHAVVRLKRDVGGAGYVGAMVTDQRSSSGWSTAGGVDWQLRLRPTLTISGFGAATANAAGTGNGWSARVAAEYVTDKVGATLSHVGVSPDATADLGFVTRTDIQRTDASFRVTPRPTLLGLRKLDLYLFGQRIADTDGRVLDWLISPSLNPEWSSGESVFAWYGWGFTRLEEGFRLSDSVDVAAGDFDTWQIGWFANSSQSRPIVFRSVGFLQGAYGGTLQSYSAEVSLAPSPNLAVTFRYGRNLADLPGGSFAADIGAFRLTVAASARLVANALVQYNSFENTIGANLRVSYTFRPGSDLFLVLNEQRGDESRLWRPGDRAALIKLTYLSRF